MHVFNLIGVHVWRGGLNCRGQVIDDFFLWRWFVQSGNRVANFKREVGFSRTEHFGRVFIEPLSLRILGHAIHHALRALKGNLFNFLPVHVEDNASKAGCAGVIEVDHGAFGTSGRFNGALD